HSALPPAQNAATSAHAREPRRPPVRLAPTRARPWTLDHLQCWPTEVTTCSPGGARKRDIRAAASATCESICTLRCPAGAKITITSARVDSVTEVLRESEVGLPKGPSGSLRVGRPSRFTASLRIPAYDSPVLPRRSVTGGVTFAASYSPIG